MPKRRRPNRYRAATAPASRRRWSASVVTPESLQTTLGSFASSSICARHGSISPSLIPGLPIWSSTKLTSGQRRTISSVFAELRMKDADVEGRAHISAAASALLENRGEARNPGRPGSGSAAARRASSSAWRRSRSPARSPRRAPAAARRRRPSAARRLPRVASTQSASSRYCGASTSTSTKTMPSIS